MDTNERIIKWFLTGDVGTSSEAIVAQMTGIETSRAGVGDHPHNGGDFGRCHKLLEAIPEFLPRLKEMAGRSPEWAALVEHWEELTLMCQASEMMSKRMAQILAAVKNKRGVDLGNGATLYA